MALRRSCRASLTEVILKVAPISALEWPVEPKPTPACGVTFTPIAPARTIMASGQPRMTVTSTAVVSKAGALGPSTGVRDTEAVDRRTVSTAPPPTAWLVWLVRQAIRPSPAAATRPPARTGCPLRLSPMKSGVEKPLRALRPTPGSEGARGARLTKATSLRAWAEDEDDDAKPAV